uniref:Putative transcriptional regulator n=1 Tax=termite gut metagenome TaxID=433724 RepID=S0DE68_9ZZZZ
MALTDKPETSAPRLSSPYGIELVKHLKPFAEIRLYQPGDKLQMIVDDSPLCYLILEGTVATHRVADDVLLGSVQSPSLVGIANMSRMNIEGYIKALTPCKIGIIPAGKAREIIDKDGLWETLSEHMMMVASRLMAFGQDLSAPTAYEVIRQQLLILMSEDQAIRRDITAEKYIREKTTLSRSRIMRILSDLKTGGYIDIERGRLLKIHKLPEKY